MVPPYIKKYFWEVDTQKLNPKKTPEYIIARILEYGNTQAIQWAWKTFSKNNWLLALKLREVSKKTQSFWLPLLSQKK